MNTGKKSNQNMSFRMCADELKEAQSSGDAKKICVAMINMGYACFRVRKYEEGMKNFAQAFESAVSLDDATLQIHGLAIKTLAFQEIGRLPDAYETAKKIYDLGEQLGDLNVKCDALTSQAQILLDSGEPTLSFDLLRSARQIADELGDKRRLMNVLGAFGNFSIAVAEPEQATSYFTKAQSLALELGDQQAECGFSNNLGSVLAWQGKHRRALEAFHHSLTYLEEMQDVQAQIGAYLQIAKLYNQMEDDGKVVEFAKRGFALAKDGSKEGGYAFLEILIQAYCRQNDTAAVQQIADEAAAYARSKKDAGKEIEFTISVGEFFMGVEDAKKALTLYRDALVMAKEFKREKDEAYLTGRIALALSELGSLDEAMAHHQQAIELARQNDLAGLEAEQLSMLAIAYLEKNQIVLARSSCESALEKYTAAKLDKGVAEAKRLLNQILTAEAG